MGVRARRCLLLVAGLLAGGLAPVSPAGIAQAQNQLEPVAIAEVEVVDDATATTPAVVELDGSDSFDPDFGGSIVRYQWEVVTEAYQWLELEQDSIRSPIAIFEVPAEKLVERLGYSIEFRLTVTDSGRPPATDSDVVVFSINQAPVANIKVTANLLDRDDEPGYDDNRNGTVDENEERYSVEGVLAAPGEMGNAANEWDIRASTLLVLDGSGSFDPDGELGYAGFSWELLAYRGAQSVAGSLPIGDEGDTVDGQMALSTDEDPLVPGSPRAETVARLPFTPGVGTEPFLVYYRLTVTDEDGASASEIVKIVIQDFHDDPEVEIGHPESDPDAASDGERREGVLAAGEDRYVVSSQAAEDGVLLAASAMGDGRARTAGLVHTWSGDGVDPGERNEPGRRSEALFTAPEGTEEGDSFLVEVEVVDPDGLTASASVELVVADTTAPVAIVPDDIDTPDGLDGGFPASDPPTGVVVLRGTGFDPDGDELAYRWEQVRNRMGDELNRAFRGSRLFLAEADTQTASFKLPEVTRGSSETLYVQFTVTDRWGVSDSEVVAITIRDGDDDLEARPGVDQLVQPGSFVRLVGGFRSGLVSADALSQVEHQWVYKGIETYPPASDRPPATLAEQARGFVPGGWLPNPDGTYDPTAGGRLRNLGRAFAHFDAPELHGFNAVELVFELTVRYRDDHDTGTVAVTVMNQAGRKYFSGPVGGLGYCANRSLGGPATYPLDSDGDGTADTCALRGTRRGAIARQIALAQLAILNPQDFSDALFGLADDPRTEHDETAAGACGSAPDDLGDTDEELAGDACSRYRRNPDADLNVSPAPDPVDPAKARAFYSGAIDGPTFCANWSLGGPPTYPFDGDGDGTADTCALPYTRREAAARHSALEAAFAHHPQFPSALAAACASLGTLDFGDHPHDLARDHCARPTSDGEKGRPLPTPSQP